MAEEEKEQQQQEEQAPAEEPKAEEPKEEEAPEAEEQTEPEASGDGASPEEDKEGAKAEVPAGEEAPAEGPDGAGGEPAAEAGGDEASAEDQEKLSPRQLRKIARATEVKPQNPSLSIEEKVKQRAEARAAKAKARSRYRVSHREKAKKSRGEVTPPLTAERHDPIRKFRQGIVVSDKADKTITVKVEIKKPHKVYKKIVSHSRKLHAHDEGNDAKTGDTVRIVEARPTSRSKRWRLVEVVERAR